MSSIKKQEQKDHTKDIYFMILYKLEKENFPNFENSKIKPECILISELKGDDGTNFYNIVLKIKNNIKDNSSKKDYSIEFSIGNQSYLVYFEVNENIFVYDLNLIKTLKILINFTKEKIDQNLIHYGKKFNYFLEALKTNNEEDKIEELFKETIHLYSQKKFFSLLIPLFVQIYKNKELCPLLMEKFIEMNINSKGFFNNKDRKNDLRQYKENFERIFSEADNLIKNNAYDSIQFYGIILCYLNCYDYNNFLLVKKELIKKNIEDLYDILNIFSLHFLNSIDENAAFFIKFINYIASKSAFANFENVLKMIKDLETLIIVLEKTKRKIIKRYANTFNSSQNNFHPIEIKDNIKFIKKDNNQEMEAIIPAIESIINFSKEEKVLLVYFTSNLWKKFLEEYKNPTDINIYNCYRLRELLINYNDLINELFKYDKYSNIKIDINKLLDEDNFSKLLDKNIKKYLKKYCKELTNAEILGFFGGFNPYYKEEKYYNQRELYIFDYIDFNDNSKQFIETFKNMQFEKIFKDKFNDIIISKISNINTFGVIIELINISKIQKVNSFFIQLNEKYEKIVKKQIETLKDEKIKEAVKILAKYFEIKFFREKNLKYIRDKINKLDNKIGSLIYYEMLKKCKDDEYKKMKDFIYSQLNIDIIISLIDYLDEKDKNNFMEEIMNICKFTKEEFYSNINNNKILLLYDLYRKGKISMFDEEKHFMNIERILGEILNEIEGELSIKKLEEFLKNEKVVIKKLGLIKIILNYFNPSQFYQDLIKLIEENKKDVNNLTYIKNSLQIFHREKYRKEIKTISRVIKELTEKSIKNYKTQKMQATIQALKNLKSTADQVEKYKDFLFFKVLYDNEHGNDQDKIFQQAKKKLNQIQDLFKTKASANEIYQNNKDIFNKIKEILSNDESKTNKFINQIIDYFKIENKILIKDLIIIFKSKNFERDLKSIIYFFESFQKDNILWNKQLSSKYKNLSGMELEELKNNLKELKINGIYDYEKDNNYCKLFTYLYGKKEAIDFLLTKTNKEINALFERIEPTNPIISFEIIQDTEICINLFNTFKELNDNFKILNYIKAKLNNKESLSKFEKYSKNYSSIIELERNDNFSINLYEQVNNIIKDAIFIFKQDREEFSYGQNCETTMKELIHLKNKIYINSSKEFNDALLRKKCDKLDFFKKLINNLEIISEYIEFIRIKGNFNIISIHIRYPDIKYYLGENIISFEEIRDFLFLEKAKYIGQLDSIYKNNEFLRFLFGKQFSNIMRHIDGDYNALDNLRFILNKTDNNKEIKDIIETKSINKFIVEDYMQIQESKTQTQKDDSFEFIEKLSNYLTSFFEKNDLSLQKHYESMLIKNKNIYKGIYLHKCENESKEEFILKLFFNLIGKLPIAQNILISSKDTSYEEIQAFFYRAILCEFNTLFVCAINDSFSDSQQNVMFALIDSLLSYKNEKYKESQNKKNIEKSKTRDYLNSCITFIYEQNNKANLSFLNELGNFDTQKFMIDLSINKINILKKSLIENYNNELLKRKFTNYLKNSTSLVLQKRDSQYTNKFKNIKVITSDKCGLGKSFKIKLMIEKNKKKYFHFLLGGILSKTIIFKKLSNLLKKITEDIEENNYKSVAIHLDLIESQEINLINEFLFSFLITKFYTNNENIIFIPKDIDIYIEIPNCFENYISKFGILNDFHKENISFENKPKLDLPQDTIDIFNKILKLNSKDLIESFIKKYIGIKEYSYHQVWIFIKFFIFFYNDKKEIDDDSLKLNSSFSKLNMEQNKYFERKDSFELISKAYNNELKNNNILEILFDINKITNQENSSAKEQDSKYYLQKIKEILNLPNEIENEIGDKKSLLSILNCQMDNYAITKDNFTKMILLSYRIKANIPIIIMGETGCGKTALIIKLNQILNNGEVTVKKINIHPWLTDEDIYKKIKEIDEEAKNDNEKEIWLFFDEINTCLSISLFVEIFTQRTYNGENLSGNIRLIGACNPYRKKKANEIKYGLKRDENNENELIYLVQPLPQSLSCFVFNFGLMNEEDEKEYIYHIIEKLFKNDEKNLHEVTRDAIFQCHKFLRETFDPSVVSLRDISRFSKCVEFFQKYYTIKNEYDNENNEIDKEIINIEENQTKLNKIKSIICSIYICYYLRLLDDKRNIFNCRLRKILLKLVNLGEIENDIKGDEEKENNEEDNLIDEINYKELKYDLKEEIINQFSDILKIEEEFLIDKIDLDKGIGKNNLLKENVFLMFLSLITKIPLFIVGNPGTGKTLSTKLIYNSMRGKYSNNKFFRKFPQIVQTYFQGTESTMPEDVEKLFEIAENKSNSSNKNMKKEMIPISLVIFDELGLAEKSKSYPLKILHSRLEYANNGEGVSFIGISNFSLDVSKENRCLNLLVPNLEDRVDQLINISKSIVQSISKDLSNNIIFEILSTTYYEYKNFLNFIKELTVFKQFKTKNNESDKPIDLKSKQFSEIKNIKEFKNLLKEEKKIKVDFHGNRDLYNLILGIAREMGQLNNLDDNEIALIIEKYIERNFGGIDYEIDIDLDMKIADIEDKIKFVNDILEEHNSNNKNEKKEKISLSSVVIFKKLYNLVCGSESPYKISNHNIEEYDLNKCIKDNISENINETRYLLLEINPTLSSLIYQTIKLQNPNPDLDKSKFTEGSPFEDDNNNNEYRYKKVNEIQEYAKSDKLIVFQNLNEIQPFLYDLCNMNYIIKDNQKYARVCLDSVNEQLTPINDNFRMITLVDKKFINEADIEYLNRFEKIKISFDKLLNKEQLFLAKQIIDEINFDHYIGEYQEKINYSLKDLLINSGKEEIEGLIYNCLIKIKKNKIDERDENNIKEIVYNIISNILPQDIISILPENHKIAKNYYEEKQYFNLKEYITDKVKKDFKISIIYTFTNISSIINGINREMKFMVSEIKSENHLKNLIVEIKNKNENSNGEKNYNIFIHFDQSNSKKIQFISNFIINRLKEDNYNYIFIIHVKRNFKSQTNYDMVYSLSDINPDIKQIFIDNLNAINIKLKELFDKSIKDILSDNVNAELMDLDKEFERTLKNFVNEEFIEEKNISNNISSENTLMDKENYVNEIQKYMDEEVDFKRKIIDKAKELIDNDKEAEGKCKSLIDKLFKTNYIDRNSQDIISCLLDYIKEKIFGKYLKHILKVLEDNNILTTLIEIKNNKNKELEERIIEQLKVYFLNKITMEENNYQPKFFLNYKIPGFFNLYMNLSNYINKTIAVEFFNNETKLREYYGKEEEKQEKEFHEKEEDLLSLVYDKISEDNFIFDIINKISPDLILKDYITYYLDINISDEYKSEMNNKLIELLLKLRFNEEKNQIIKKNKNDLIKILLIKIIWIVSNVNYILSILKIFYYAKILYNDENKLYNQMEEIIYNESNCLKYITNQKRNPKHTTEVNECFYIILASLCLCVTSENIKLTKELYQEGKIEINKYCEVLKKMNNILQKLNNNLYIYLNEMYIIDELKEVIDLQKLKDINIEKIEEIRKNLRESALIIQNNKADKIRELIENFKKTYNSLSIKEIKTEKDKDKKYYDKYFDTIKYIFLKEIIKISDQKYRYKIIEYLLREKEIIKKSNDILQLLLKKIIIVKSGEKGFKQNLHYILKEDIKKEYEILPLIEKYLDDKKDNYLSLSETMLYFCEKNSIIYFQNTAKDSILLENEPLDIFEKCIAFLKDYIKKSKKIEKKLKNVSKIYCIGYIKAFCSTFVKTFDDVKPKFKDLDKIIDSINKNDINNMVKLYIYKILFNEKHLDAFLNPKSKEKYKLEKFKGFKDFLKIQKNEEINYGFETLDNENYKNVYNVIESNKKEDFKNKIKKQEIISSGKFFIDNFYNASKNIILSNLKNKELENSYIFDNFYQNICLPMLENNKMEKLSIAIKILFDPKKYKEIQKEYGINYTNIEAILYGYRYCLNELSDETDGIYCVLYERDNISHLSENYYPGGDFGKNNKNNTKLSQISYRLLNYLFYSNLFFARILTNLKKFDNCLQEGMNWGDTLNNCWTLLKSELSKNGINSIDSFMDFTFKPLFEKLHNRESNDDYDGFVDFEEKLEEIIQEKVELVKKENEKYKILENGNKNASINLLKEKYESQNPEKEYPFYEFFYYSDYLNEKSISEKLSSLDLDENNYQTLRKYLEFIKIIKENKDEDEDEYSLDKLNKFNNTLNLFSKKYSGKITREYAEIILLKDSEIYKDESNKKKIKDFIKFYNKLKLKDSKGNIIELKSNKNHLCDFFIDSSNEIGKTYKDIYEKFIKKQNEEIENLLNIKSEEGILDDNCKNKINIQRITKDEIFTINEPEIFSFINAVFNSSYRKVIDNNNYGEYNQYEINFESIERDMTDSLLKNKKLLNEIIIEFSYNNEAFNNEVNDLITIFKKNYKTEAINSDDKEFIDNYIKENKNNKSKYKDLIDDFLTIMQNLNDSNKEDKDKVFTEKSNISEIYEKLKNNISNISKEFLLVFKDKGNCTIDKIYSTFEYFLKSIYNVVIDEIKNYQGEFEVNGKELEDKRNQLDEYYQTDPLISKDNLASAILLFMILVLFREKDKEKKIKFNSLNILIYLKKPDLWEQAIYNDEKFDENLNKLKKINIKINQILWLYNYLIDYKEEKTEEAKDYNEIQKEESDSENIKNKENEITNSKSEDKVEVISEEKDSDNDEENNKSKEDKSNDPGNNIKKENEINNSEKELRKVVVSEENNDHKDDEKNEHDENESEKIEIIEIKVSEDNDIKLAISEENNDNKDDENIKSKETEKNALEKKDKEDENNRSEDNDNQEIIICEEKKDDNEK